MMYQQPLHQQAHTPAPPGPFRHLQVDYISLPPCKGKTDVLVVIDKFSRWVEAYQQGALQLHHTAKCLVTDFIPDGDTRLH